MNRRTCAALGHVCATLIFIPILLPLLILVAVLASVFMCAVVYERLYIGIKSMVFQQQQLCDYCREGAIVDNKVEKVLDKRPGNCYNDINSSEK